MSCATIWAWVSNRGRLARWILSDHRYRLLPFPYNVSNILLSSGAITNIVCYFGLRFNYCVSFKVGHQVVINLTRVRLTWQYNMLQLLTHKIIPNLKLRTNIFKTVLTSTYFKHYKITQHFVWLINNNTNTSVLKHKINLHYRSVGTYNMTFV